MDLKTKKIVPNKTHLAFRKDAIALIKKYGDELRSDEVLALTAHLLGQVIAFQGQRKMTTDMVWKVVGDNIESGNKEALKEVLESKGTA